MAARFSGTRECRNSQYRQEIPGFLLLAGPLDSRRIAPALPCLFLPLLVRTVHKLRVNRQQATPVSMSFGTGAGRVPSSWLESLISLLVPSGMAGRQGWGPPKISTGLSDQSHPICLGFSPPRDQFRHPLSQLGCAQNACLGLQG